jgi:hypothetical protein
MKEDEGMKAYEGSSEASPGGFGEGRFASSIPENLQLKFKKLFTSLLS